MISARGTPSVSQLHQILLVVNVANRRRELVGSAGWIVDDTDEWRDQVEKPGPQIADVPWRRPLRQHARHLFEGICINLLVEMLEVMLDCTEVVAATSDQHADDRHVSESRLVYSE